MNVNLSHLINTDARAYAIYTVESRGIPNLIDGLKPVQRFVLYRALELGTNNNKFFKLASIAGGVADVGYHHGEASAQEAGALMANTWNNNYPILDGQGNFGSRLVQEAAASRYIYCRVGKRFFDMYKDTNVAPKHADPEHLPPAFYLPVIPTVLLNGIRGIGTGYSTQILPHSLKSVIECTKLAVQDKLDKEPSVSYPEFNGDVVSVEPNKYELHGKFEFIGKKLYISEVPPRFDRASYVEVLDGLEEKNLISYEDDCGKNGFGFKVTLRKDYKLPATQKAIEAKIKDDFKLIQKVTQYIVVIDENGSLNDKFASSSELIRYFVDVRKGYIAKRIVMQSNSIGEKLKEINARIAFIAMVIDGTLVLKGKTRLQVIQEAEQHDVINGYGQLVIQMPIYQMTKDEIQKLKSKKLDLEADLKYWKSTTVVKEYLKDISELEKSC